MAKIISVAVPKGGVGKSTTSVNLSASLAIAEKKTLLIDFDATGSSTMCFGFDEKEKIGNIFDVLSFKKSIHEVIYETEIPNLDILPSKILPTDEERLHKITNNHQLFNHILQQGTLEKYDYIIIDCPPYLQGLTTISLISSNSVILPIKSGKFSCASIQKMLEYIDWIKTHYNPKLKLEGIVLNMYEKNTVAWKMTIENINKCYGKYVFNTVIPKNTNLCVSEFLGKPAVLINAKSIGANAFFQLTKEILGKYKKKKKLADLLQAV